MAKKTVKRPSVAGKANRSTKPKQTPAKKQLAVAAKAPAKSARNVAAKAALKVPSRSSTPVAKSMGRSVTKAVERPAKTNGHPARTMERATAKGGGKANAAAPVRMAEKGVEKGKSDRPGKAADAHGALPLPPAILAAQQPANGKPRKSQAGFSSRELEHFRELLLAKRRELIGDMSSMEREALRTGGGSNLSNLPIHMADMGTDNYEQEFTLGLVQKERDLLKEINLALAKIPLGTYGLCEGTGSPILKERLEFQPWARYSVEYQRKLERHGR